MTNYQITVIKVFESKDVIGEEFIRDSGEPISKCGILEENQVFMTNEMLTFPQGFFPHAWFGIFKELWMLRMGCSYPDWAGKNTMFASCPDGIRPVCFKIERLD